MIERSGPVELTVVEEGVAVLAMDDETGKNTFTDALVAGLLAAFSRLSEEEAIRVVIVRGRQDVFCAGAPKALLAELVDGAMVPSDIVLAKMMLDVPVPTIAAMEGHGVGGGLALALCCDMIVAAEESRYGCSFMNMGFTPGMGITRLLQLAVGEYLANEMMFGGQMLKGRSLKGRSAINAIVPKAEVYVRALGLARRVAEKPRHALVTLKRTLSLPRRRAYEETRTTEVMMHELCFSRPETAALIEENYAASRHKEKA